MVDAGEYKDDIDAEKAHYYFSLPDKFKDDIKLGEYPDLKEYQEMLSKLNELEILERKKIKGIEASHNKNNLLTQNDGAFEVGEALRVKEERE